MVIFVATASKAELGLEAPGEPMLYFHSDGKPGKESDAGRDEKLAVDLWDFSQKAVGLV